MYKTNNMKRILPFACFILLISPVYSQDTIRVMHYNLLCYGQTCSYSNCTSSNNDETAKNGYLKTIIKYAKPDIFTVNEIAKNAAKHQLLMNNCLNVDGVTYYQKCNYSNQSNSDLTNELYYNSDKLGFCSQYNIGTSVRDINIYKLYFKAGNLSTTHDTAFFTCIVTHLKAGNTSSDSIERATITNTIMNYLNSIGVKDNYMAMGDFNVYSGNEKCFQNLVNYTNPDIRFFDPVNKIGNWHDDSYYADYHTQSTHTSSTGCFSTGGIDDRFDFILISDYIKNGTQHFQYIPSTYKAIGQDGNHLNDAVNYGTNNSAPDSVIDALYGMSDHLPVILDLRVNQTAGINNLQIPAFTNVYFANPVNDNMDVTVEVPAKTKLIFNVINLLGQILYSKEIETTGTIAYCSISTESLYKGIYFLKVSDSGNNSIVRKFVKG